MGAAGLVEGAGAGIAEVFIGSREVAFAAKIVGALAFSVKTQIKIVNLTGATGLGESAAAIIADVYARGLVGSREAAAPEVVGTTAARVSSQVKGGFTESSMAVGLFKGREVESTVGLAETAFLAKVDSPSREGAAPKAIGAFWMSSTIRGIKSKIEFVGGVGATRLVEGAFTI